MGRKDTITAKNIQKMYEQLCLDQKDILHRTKLLLSVYRDVVWITLNKSANLTEELIYYCDDQDFLYIKSMVEVRTSFTSNSTHIRQDNMRFGDVN